jgi:3-hydroxyisobutyrate dehydrogenase-like beta-hydroxyacid dehydrogenase
MSDQEIKIIGFIGLGVMGSSMSKNLLKNKNWNVLVKDLDHNKEKELENKVLK